MRPFAVVAWLGVLTTGKNTIVPAPVQRDAPEAIALSLQPKR